MKIIIIGAGVAGLVLASACSQEGMEVKLYEKAKQLQTIGGGVVLWPNGWRYLSWLGLSERIQSYRPNVISCRTHGAKGNEINNEAYTELYARLNGGYFPIERSLLQKTLLTYLPDNRIAFNKTCVAIKESEKEGCVFFSDGTSDSADIIIGADGVHSSVRECLSDNKNIDDSGYCWWGGIIEQRKIPTLPTDETFFAIEYGKILFVWPLHDGNFMWYIAIKIDPSLLILGEQGFNQLKTLCAKWQDVKVQQLLAVAEGLSYFQVPIKTVSPKQSWLGQRTTLIGDAAHAMGPLLGLGTNLAIEDAFVLFHLLKNTDSDISHTIRKYESLRYSKVSQLTKLEAQSAAAVINADILEMDIFQQGLYTTNLLTEYKDLIPYIDENACQQMAEQVSIRQQ